MATTIGSVIEGKYEILAEIGRGGMSCVYLARDTRLNKSWAVKEVRKRGRDANGDVYVQSLVTEANMMMNFNHPAFPRIVDIIETEDVIYIVMDYIEGESLDKVLKAQGAQPYERVVDWGTQLAEALRYLHSQDPPIIYRDMKPANIMYQEVAGVDTGLLKIIDFGTAREYKQTKSADTVVMATPGYASPEQVNKTRQTDARSDIYCLGMTLHHLLTGQDPTKDDYEYRPIRQWNPDLPLGLEMLIEQCIALDPDDRFQTCEELIYWLQKDSNGHYRFEEFSAEYRKQQRNKLIRFGAFAAAAVLFALLAIGSRVTGSVVTNRNYDAATAAVGTELIPENERAIKEIDGNRLDAYNNLVQAYKDSGRFDKQESQQISGLISTYYKGDVNDPDYLKLCYDIGYLYFNFYTEDGSEGFAQRASHAASYFERIQTAVEANPDLKLPDAMKPWKSYYELANTFKKSSGLTVAESHSAEELRSILTAVTDCVNSMANNAGYDGSDADSIRLSQARYFANQLNGLKNEFVSSGVSEDEVLEVMQLIRSSEQSVTLQQLDEAKAAALAECDDFIVNIQNAYYGNQEG